MVYIFFSNDNSIFYGAPAVLLNSQEDFISVSSNINFEQVITPDIFRDKDNSLIK